MNFLKKIQLKKLTKLTIYLIKDLNYNVRLVEKDLVISIPNTKKSIQLSLSLFEQRYQTHNKDLEVYKIEIDKTVRALLNHNAPLLKEDIFPRLVLNLKSTDDAEEPYNNMFKICFVSDIGAMLLFVKNYNLKTSKLKMSELKEIAVQNLYKIADTIKTKLLDDGLWLVECNKEALSSSLILLPNFLESLKINIKGDPVIFTPDPCTSFFMVADSTKETAILSAAARSIDLLSEHPPWSLFSLCFASPIVIKNGKWIVYNIEDEHPKLAQTFCRNLKIIDHFICYNHYTNNINEIAARENQYAPFIATPSYVTLDEDGWDRIFYCILQPIETVGKSFIPIVDLVWVIPDGLPENQNRKGKMVPLKVLLDKFESKVKKVNNSTFLIEEMITVDDLEKLHDIPFTETLNFDS